MVKRYLGRSFDCITAPNKSNEKPNKPQNPPHPVAPADTSRAQGAVCCFGSVFLVLSEELEIFVLKKQKGSLHTSVAGGGVCCCLVLPSVPKGVNLIVYGVHIWMGCVHLSL